MNILIERGGAASPEELAAILLALSAIVPDKGRPNPAWQQAALREALGAPAAQSAADVAEPPGVPPVLV